MEFQYNYLMLSQLWQKLLPIYSYSYVSLFLHNIRYWFEVEEFQLRFIIFMIFPEATQEDKKQTDQPNHESSIINLYNQYKLHPN